MNITENLQKAKQLLEEADAIFITAGAGMGVDSGLSKVYASHHGQTCFRII